MERRFAARRDQLLADAEVDPRILRGVLPRLERFLDPFVELLQRSEQGGHARSYVAGLVSDLEYKNVESIAYLHDREREPLQQFIGQSPWDHGPWLAELARQVGRELGGPDGVLVLDPSAFPKKGDASVGVQRQWCGRLGKIDNCQVGVYLAYVGPSEHALVDVRLYLPKEWAKDKRRREQAGVPREVRFRTRHELALEMHDDRGLLLAHAWVADDDEMGRCSWFREHLEVAAASAMCWPCRPTPPCGDLLRRRPAVCGPGPSATTAVHPRGSLVRRPGGGSLANHRGPGGREGPGGGAGRVDAGAGAD